jgi:hypothetical protein
MQITAYAQTWSDIEAGIGDRAKAGVITGNFNTLVMLRATDARTAELLTEQLPRVEIQTLLSVSGVNDSADPRSGQHFTSTNQDRIVTETVPMLTPAEIRSLPKGQAFALLHGGLLYKLRLPLPDASADGELPAGLEAIARAMRRGSSTGDGWHRTRLDDWAAGGAGEAPA